MISIPKMYRPEQTTSLSLHGANRVRRCDFSKDREGRANFEYFAVIYRLAGNVSIFRQQHNLKMSPTFRFVHTARHFM